MDVYNFIAFFIAQQKKRGFSYLQKIRQNYFLYVSIIIAADIIQHGRVNELEYIGR